MSTFSGFGRRRRWRLQFNSDNQPSSDNQFSNNEDNESRRSHGTRQPENNRGLQDTQPFPRTSRHDGQHRTTMNPVDGTDRDNQLRELERMIQGDRAEHLRVTREALEYTQRYIQSRLQSAPYLISIGISTVAEEEARLTQYMQREQRLQSELDDLERVYSASDAREGRPMGNVARSGVHQDRVRARASQPRALNAAAVGRRSPTPPPPYEQARTPPPTYEEAIASGTNRTISVNPNRAQRQLTIAAAMPRIHGPAVPTPRRILSHHGHAYTPIGQPTCISSTENQQSRSIVGRVVGEDEQTSYRERSSPTHGRRYDVRQYSMGDRNRSKSPRARHNPGRSSVGATSNRPALLGYGSSHTREPSSHLQANPVGGGPRDYRASAQRDNQAQQPAARSSSLPMMGPYAVTEDYATLPNSSNDTPFRQDQRQVFSARPNRTPAQPEVNFAGDTDGDLPMGDADDDGRVQSRGHIGRSSNVDQS